MTERASGLLLHITSLPSQRGIGDLGLPAFEFINFLSDAGQKYWQLLPLNPTELAYGNSPYSSPSTYAGNPLLISLELMMEDGLLSRSDLISVPAFPKDRVNYNQVAVYKMNLLKTAYEVNKDSISKDGYFKEFCKENEHWLADYSLYTAIKDKFGSSTWHEFPKEIKERVDTKLAELSRREESNVLFNKFLQFVFYKQFEIFKKYANSKGIQIIGDLPYYINYDSCDVWVNQEIFKLDINKTPEFIAGVPPDYFSKTGQLWGNPVYNWDRLKQLGYSWWLNRIGHNLSMYDKLRLDHFRGFVSYWEVNAGEKTALNGKWIHLDAEDFLDELFSRFEKSRIIAEDLGLITKDVKDIIKYYDLPGMKILLFAFGNDFPHGDYLPKNINANCVIYTGTHDNNTVLGWWNSEASDSEKQKVSIYIGRDFDESQVNWEMVRLAMESKARIAIIPMQDILGLGESTRMNTPSTTRGNWEWKLLDSQLNINIANEIREITEGSGRC